MNKDELLDRVIDLEEVAIDSAPFQLVLGSSLYKVYAQPCSPHDCLSRLREPHHISSGCWWLQYLRKE